MKTSLLPALPALATALLLAACGGGDDVQTSTPLSGIAAVGAPVAAGDVSVTCGTGAAVATTTSATGTWTVNVTSPTFPCVVKVTGGSLPAGVELYGYAATATNVNVTPLTTLIGAYAANAANGGAITQAMLDTATTKVLADLTAAGFGPLPSNPLTAPFSPANGDAHDDVIEAIMLSLAQQGTTLAEIAQEIATTGEPASGDLVKPSVTAFSSMGNPFPYNMPSYGPEAYALTSLGDRIQLATDTPRKLRTVTVGMSSWACQQGAWHTADCVSAADATFTHPITLSIYADGSNTALATVTQTFTMPYRPSTDPNCTGGRWTAADGTCYNGRAFKITFDLQDAGVTLPDNVRYEISYNTRTAGPAPIGGASGPYDSLNVGTNANAPSVGTDLDPGFLYWNGTPKDEGLGLMVDFQTGS